MLNRYDLYWLAGWLEGEGSFHFSKQKMAGISAASTDYDVMQKVAILMKCKLHGPYVEYSTASRDRSFYKPQWQIEVSGPRAVGWIMTLYTLMGHRRRARIKDVLALWRAVKARPNAVSRNRKLFYPYGKN